MKFPPSLSALALCACWLAAPAMAQPSLTRAVPAGIPAGRTTEVTLHGAKLAGATAVWTSFPARAEIVGNENADDNDDAKQVDAKQLRVRITPEKDTPVQIGALVVATKDGATAPLMIMVDDLPSVAEDGNNTSASGAQAIDALDGVDGVSQAGSSDFYAVEASAGQRLSVEVVAQRMGSKFDPVVWLRDADGRVLHLADDDANLGADCRFSYVCQVDGRYLLEVRDNAYRAGLPYRLRVGDFPVVSTTLPLGVRGGRKTRLALAGADTAGAAPIVVEPPTAGESYKLPVAGRRKGGDSSALAAVVVSNLDELSEQAASAAGQAPAPLSPPCAVNGRLADAGERDAYLLPAKKGDKLRLTATGQSLGSPTLIALQILNDKGAVLAETPFDALGEPSLAWTAPADGDYVLSVRDLLDRGGPAFTYRVAVEPVEPDFSLSLKPDGRSQASLPGENAYLAIDVVCQRQGYNGPIELQVEGPVKFTLRGNKLREKATSAKLTIELAGENPAGTLLPLKIVGEAKIGGKDVRRTASTVALLRTETPELLHPPVALDGWVTVGVQGEAKPLFELPAPKSGVTFTQGSEETTFTLTPKRIDANLKSNLALTLEGLPEGFSHKLKVEGKAPKEKYEITLRGPKDAPAAEHQFTLVARGDIGGVGQVLRQSVKLHVAEPAKEKSQGEPEAKSDKKAETKDSKKE